MNDDLAPRVSRLEETARALSTDMATMACDLTEVRNDVGSLRAKIDRMVNALAGTDRSSAERAAAVKTEIRDEEERKSRARSDLFKNGLVLLGGVALIVGAMAGPYLNKVNATADAAGDAGRSIAQVLASHGEDIVRNQDSNEISRERSRAQEERIYDIDRRVAHQGRGPVIIDPNADVSGHAVTAIADLCASSAIDEAFAAEFQAIASAPDRAPLYHDPYDI